MDSNEGGGGSIDFIIGTAVAGRCPVVVAAAAAAVVVAFVPSSCASKLRCLSSRARPATDRRASCALRTRRLSSSATTSSSSSRLRSASADSRAAAASRSCCSASRARSCAAWIRFFPTVGEGKGGGGEGMGEELGVSLVGGGMGWNHTNERHRGTRRMASEDAST